MNRQEKLQDALEWVETLQENYGGQEETQDLAEALGVAAEAIKTAQADTLTKIRAEIEKKRARAKQMSSVLQMNAYTDCLHIIDKYKEDKV